VPVSVTVAVTASFVHERFRRWSWSNLHRFGGPKVWASSAAPGAAFRRQLDRWL